VDDRYSFQTSTSREFLSVEELRTRHKENLIRKEQNHIPRAITNDDFLNPNDRSDTFSEELDAVIITVKKKK